MSIFRLYCSLKYDNEICYETKVPISNGSKTIRKRIKKEEYIYIYITDERDIYSWLNAARKRFTWNAYGEASRGNSPYWRNVLDVLVDLRAILARTKTHTRYKNREKIRYEIARYFSISAYSEMFARRFYRWTLYFYSQRNKHVLRSSVYAEYDFIESTFRVQVWEVDRCGTSEIASYRYHAKSYDWTWL